jgi:hypothetical protein
MLCVMWSLQILGLLLGVTGMAFFFVGVVGEKKGSGPSTQNMKIGCGLVVAFLVLMIVAKSVGP